MTRARPHARIHNTYIYNIHINFIAALGVSSAVVTHIGYTLVSEYNDLKRKANVYLVQSIIEFYRMVNTTDRGTHVSDKHLQGVSIIDVLSLTEFTKIRIERNQSVCSTQVK